MTLLLYLCILRLGQAQAAAPASSTYTYHEDRVASVLSRAPPRLRNRAAQISALPSSIPSLQHRSFRGFRVQPEYYGADPSGLRDSTAALQQAVNVCVKRARDSHNGVFPGSEDQWGPVRDAGGCLVDLDGGEYRISKTIFIPEFVANMHLGHGSIVADPTHFTFDNFLIVIGGKGSCNVPQGSCNMDLNFPELFLSGSNVANAIQINNVMGVTIGPGGYFLNFTRYGVQVNAGHEVMMDRCWLGETNFDYKFSDHGTEPNATAIEINGNDHYILNTIVFSSKVGVAIHGAADVITGVHVWFPVNRALAFPDTKAFHITGPQNRFTGCYADGGRVVFEESGLQDNFWTGGFECCAGQGLDNVSHGIILKGDQIGPGLEIFNNIFEGGNIWHEPATPGKKPDIINSRFTDNSNALASRASQTLAQQSATSWYFDFCKQLAIHRIASVRVSLQAETGFPQHIVRPTQNCTVLVETNMAVTGSMTVDVDISSYTSSPSQGMGPVTSTVSLAV